MTSQFTITPTPPTSIKVAPGEKATFSFTITSLAAPDKTHELLLDAQLVRDDGKGAAADWLVAGPQRNLTLTGGKTATVTITARPTPSTPGGAHNIKLVVATRDAPDDEYVDSTPVVCEVGDHVVVNDKPRKPSWLLIALIAGGVVVLAGGVALWLALRNNLPGVGEPCNSDGACDTSLVCSSGTCLLAGGAACTAAQANLCVSGECVTGAEVCALPGGATCKPDDATAPCMKSMICDPATKTCKPPDPCGDRGLKCCAAGTPCNGRNLCIDGQCAECGTRGATCCAGATPCTGTDFCNASNKCEACGGRGAVCCAGATPCAAGNLCSNNVCVECGTRGNKCCLGSPQCTGTDVCNSSGTCGTCGARGGACCPGPNPCASGNLCSANVCIECGTAGNRCCSGATPCGAGLTCGGNGLCTACGGIGQPCCGGTSCNNAAACISGACHVFEVGTAETTFPGGGGGGGGGFTLRCGTGEAAIGLHGRFGALVDAIGLVCAVINKNGTIGAARNIGPVGGGGGAPFNVQCPGMVLTGAFGRSATLVDAIGGHCSTVARAAGRENTSMRDIGQFGGGGGAPFDRSCPANHVLTGISGRSGVNVDQINFICRPLFFR